MKIKPYVDKLEKSKEYKEFMDKYPDAFLIAGFFVLDFETNKNMHQIDFYVPQEKKVAAFSLDGGVKMQVFESAPSPKVPKELDLNVNIDLDALSGILKDEMHNRNISEDIKKLIAIIQNVDGKKIWSLSCVLTGMEILKSHIEDETKLVLKVEKESFLEIMKKIPGNAMPGMAGKAGVLGAPAGKGNAKDELKKLNELETEITKEKKLLEEKISSEKKSSAKMPMKSAAKGKKK